MLITSSNEISPCRAVYRTETELGIAIKESNVPRESLYVTTKVDRNSMQDIQGALRQSLSRLQLDYVNL